MNVPKEAIILAGGLGTRLGELTHEIPKPMVSIGGFPILWHILMNLKAQGVEHAVVAGGYKFDVIARFFRDIQLSAEVLKFGETGLTWAVPSNSLLTGFRVTLVDTGATTETSGRVLRAFEHLETRSDFLITYGDGLSDITIREVALTKRNSGAIVTISAHRPTSRYGLLDFDNGAKVKNFQEKPLLDGWVNIGFGIYSAEALRYFDEALPLESGPLTTLAENGLLSAYKHTGNFQPMDTLREKLHLDEIWKKGDAFWKNWN